jgi:hypothetical protein
MFAPKAARAQAKAPAGASLPQFIQRKHAIGPVDDPLEREADRIAEQMVGAESSHVPFTPATSGKAEDLQKEPGAWGDATASEALVLRSPGQPLDASTRAYFEPRFGEEFSSVRVHTDGRAAESARGVSARAYTVGQDIVFGAKEFAPGTQSWRRLLGHELAHVVQQGNGQSQALQRKPTQDDIADLELQLQSKVSERALLTGMLDDLEKRQAPDVYQRRIATPSKGEEAKLKVGAQAGRTIGGVMDATTRQLLQNRVDVVKSQDGFTLNIRFEISYEGISDKDGADRASKDIPRIEKAIHDAWTVDLKSDHYAGSKFRTEPRIKFRSNAAQVSDKSLQLVVRREPKGDSFLVGITPGRGTAISFNPKHLEGEDIITAAHELYHVFGFNDAYYIPDEKEIRKHPDGAGSKYSVGRKDLAGRGDLLGMPHKSKLREWRDKNLISQADFERQTRAQLTVWQEDADRILYRLGVPPTVPKSSGQDDPDSPAFDPQAALRGQETKIQQRLANLQRASDRYADIGDFVQKAERAIQLDKEIAALQKTIAERKAAKKP